MRTSGLREGIYDPARGDWTFDTSSLRNLEAAGLAGTIALSFVGRAHLVPEVVRELPDRSVFLTSPIKWCDVQAVMLPAQQALYALLRQRWSSEPGKDQGEAAAITLAAYSGYSLICDDGTGFRAATSQEARICTMRTTSFVVAMVRAGWVGSDQAWDGVEAMRKAGRIQLGRIPWVDRAGFDALCRLQFDNCPFGTG